LPDPDVRSSPGSEERVGSGVRVDVRGAVAARVARAPLVRPAVGLALRDEAGDRPGSVAAVPRLADAPAESSTESGVIDVVGTGSGPDGPIAPDGEGSGDPDGLVEGR
jgi:hypothetical protein